MKVPISAALFLFLLLSMSGCRKKNEADFQDLDFRYYNLEKQGWKSKNYSQKIDGMVFTATEVPIQYYLLKEMGSNNLKKVDTAYEANKEERVIEFTFENEKKQDVLTEEFTHRDYQKSVEYMAFTIQNDFYSVTSKNDTLRCKGVLFERNFKISPQSKILLFFSGIKPEEKIKLIYQDKLFGKGTLKFYFKDILLKL